MGNRKIIQLFVFSGFMAVLAACASDKEEPAQISRDERPTSGRIQMGLFQRRAGYEVESGWAIHDAVD